MQYLRDGKMLDVLKELRSEKGITQKQLGDAVGVSQQAVNSYENSETQPEFSVLVKIADYFNVSTDYLLRHSDPAYLNEDVLKYLTDEDDIETIREYLSLSHSQKKIVAELVDAISNPEKYR